LLIVTAGGVAIGLGVRGRDAATPSTPTASADDERVAELKRLLEEERKKLQDLRAHVTLKEKRLDFDRHLGRGEAALEKKRFEEAQQAYRDALKLFPDDAKALAGLAEAKTSLLAAEKTAAREKEEKDKRQADLQRLLAQAKEANAAKQYAQEVRFLDAARQLAPGDETVAKLLAQAQAVLDKDAAEKKRLSDYKTHMEAAQAALDAQRYADAVHEALAALQAVPADGDAVLLQKQAEDRLAALQNHEKRVAAHKELMQKGAAADVARRYSEAVAFYTSAQAIFPDDKATQKALKAARKARSQAKEEYDRLMVLADVARQANRLEEAHRLYKQAEEVMPGDAVAQRGMQATGNVLEDVRAGRAAYVRFMNQGINALNTQRFVDAVSAFQEALRLLPRDPDALKGLRDAQAALALPGRMQAEFGRAMEAGAAALGQRQYADAIKAFGDALKLVPDSAEAQDGLRKAKYKQAMSNGQKALGAKTFQEAIDAFQEALKEMPGDAAATAGLRQARALKK
jgi:tetratricopeptide (TPR) repeat protein